MIFFVKQKFYIMKKIYLYLLNIWTHIYTDGSLTDFGEGAGAGGTCRFFSFYKSVGKNTTNFDGEIDAIYTSQALHLASRPCTKHTDGSIYNCFIACTIR